MCCSQHVCSLDAAFVLFNPIWSMVGLAFSLCCLFLLHGFILLLQTRKKTQIPHLLIFFNKEYSVFPNLQCASCWFPFIVLPLPCPYLPPPPHPTPTSSPAVTKIDNFHASSITEPEWVYLLSFIVIVFTETLENAVCCLQSRVFDPQHQGHLLSAWLQRATWQPENIAGKSYSLSFPGCF